MADRKVVKKVWKEKDLTKVGVLKFNIWVTPTGNLLSELQVEQCVENNIEIHTHMAALTAAIQRYLNGKDLGQEVEIFKAQFKKFTKIMGTDAEKPISDVIKWQQKFEFEKTHG
jgi:formylmethanofuran dehydrogenase subunit E-like metal-binding protein